MSRSKAFATGRSDKAQVLAAALSLLGASLGASAASAAQADAQAPQQFGGGVQPPVKSSGPADWQKDKLMAKKGDMVEYEWIKRNSSGDTIAVEYRWEKLGAGAANASKETVAKPSPKWDGPDKPDKGQ